MRKDNEPQGTDEFKTFVEGLFHPKTLLGTNLPRQVPFQEQYNIPICCLCHNGFNYFWTR